MAHNATPVRAVWFDIGETLLDRTREYAAWARELGLTPHTFSAVFGAVVAEGGGVSEVLARLGCDRDAAQMQTYMSTRVPELAEYDLYPGVRAMLATLRRRGIFVGIAGNQANTVGEQLRALQVPADVIAVSATLGHRKPHSEFFASCVALSRTEASRTEASRTEASRTEASRVDVSGVAASEVLYVGDQLGNDVAAPLACGLQVARVLTGPWGRLTTDPTLEANCRAVLASAAEVGGIV